MPGDTEASTASKWQFLLLHVGVPLLEHRNPPTCRGRSRPVSIPEEEDARGARSHSLLTRAVPAAPALPEAGVSLVDGGLSPVPQGPVQTWGQGASSKPRDACWWVGGGPDGLEMALLG